LDPDGHEVRFYTSNHHTELVAGVVTRVDDPIETEVRRRDQFDTASAGD
jgi:hypothetical protein